MKKSDGIFQLTFWSDRLDTETKSWFNWMEVRKIPAAILKNERGRYAVWRECGQGTARGDKPHGNLSVVLECNGFRFPEE